MKEALYYIIVEDKTDGLELNVNCSTWYNVQEYLEANPLPYTETYRKEIGRERNDDERYPEGDTRRELIIDWVTFGALMKKAKLNF